MFIEYKLKGRKTDDYIEEIYQGLFNDSLFNICVSVDKGRDFYVISGHSFYYRGKTEESTMEVYSAIKRALNGVKSQVSDIGFVKPVILE